MDLRLPLFVRSIFSARDLNIFSTFTSPPRECKCNVVFSVCAAFSQLPPTSLFLCIRELPSPTIPILLASEQREEQNASSVYCFLVPTWLRRIPLCSCVPLHCNRLASMQKGHSHLIFFFFFQTTRGSVMKGLFKRQKSSFVLRNVFKKSATDSPVYYEPCILIGSCR